MKVLDCNQVEVINIDNGVVRLVHVNFYNRNRHCLVPTDEYYMLDDDGRVVINEARVEEARKHAKKSPAEEETLEDLVDEAMKEAEEAIEAVKKVKTAKKKASKKGKK